MLDVHEQAGIKRFPKRGITLKGGSGVDEKAVIDWLGQIKKLDELIRAKEDDIADVIDRATKMTASLDGMPHCGGRSDKVGDGAVKLADKDTAELDSLKQQRKYIIDTIKLLPANQFGVLYREYVRGMSQEQIAYDMGYCTVQVWRIKKKALKTLQDVMKCNGM
jgi:DNA-directed RNA polymerase specialized sigma subunit